MTLRDRLTPILKDVAAGGLTLSAVVDQVERRYVELAIRDNNGNLTRAAAQLGVHRNTLYLKYTVEELHAFGARTSVWRERVRARRRG